MRFPWATGVVIASCRRSPCARPNDLLRHIHLISRRNGDVTNPVGGLCGVIRKTRAIGGERLKRLRFAALGERRRESRCGTKFGFDFEQPIVFGDALAPAGRARLDLPTAHRDRKISQERILGFA